MNHHRLRAARRSAIAFAVVLLAFPAIPARVAADSTPLVPLTADQVTHRLSHEVFGYLPYWELDDGMDPYLRYDLLSTIAFFGIGVTSSGLIDTSLPGYQAYVSDRATTIINHAHAAGVRTVITFQSFGVSKNAAFFSDPVAQSTAIQQIVALMQSRGADGANVDVELIEGTYFGAYGAWVGALRQAALAVNPNTQISVATNANTSGGRMAAAAIANGADRVFLMGYDYRTSSANPVGSIDPLVRAGGGLSLTSTLQTYIGYGVPLDHVILGLPLYGRTWSTATSDLRSARVSGTAKVFYPRTLPGAASGWTFDYDPVEQSARLTQFDSVRSLWVQTYYDDPTTLAAKLSLANTQNLAGAGFWALGYDRGLTDYWDTINNAYGASRLSAIVVSPGATATLDVTVSAVYQDVGAPTTEIRFSNDNVTWTNWQPISPAVPWRLAEGQPDGTRTIWAQVRNANGAVSQVTSGVAIVDTTPPTVAPPVVSGAVRSTVGAAGDSSAVVTWSATDTLSGVASYQLEESDDGAPYVLVTRPLPASNVYVAKVLAGHTYRWRVTGTDAAGNAAAPVEGDLVRVRNYENSSSSIRYTPSWRRAPAGSASGGTVTYSSTKGATATFTFTGRSVSLVAPTGPTRGVASVLIDGVAVSNVSLYGSSNKARQLVYSRSWAVSGKHTMALKVAGTARHPRFDVDTFVVIQ